MVTHGTQSAHHRGKVTFMSEFRPSSVDASTTLVGKPLGNVEKEIAAMCVKNYLEAVDADWSMEFSWENFWKWANSSANVDSLSEHYAWIIRRFGSGIITKGLFGLTNDGYVAREERDTTYFTVKSTLVGIMQRYVVAA